jgi:hypothetical protein
MELTMPWVNDALKTGGDKHHCEIAVCRALRGCGCSPGYTEDWINDNAMTREGFKDMVREIVSSGKVDMTILCEFCERFIGIRKN